MTNVLPEEQNDPQPPELYDHLTADSRLRLEHVLVVRVPDTYDAIRGAERQTHLESNIGRTNFNEAFSHIGELAASRDMSAQDQASHLADIEDHLRRAVTEHPERVLREKIVQIDERWHEYLTLARPLRERNAMAGVPLHSDLENSREAIARKLDEARSKKAQLLPWDRTLDIAAELTEAARDARTLEDKVIQCIGAAKQILQAEAASRRDTRRFVITVVVAILACVATCLVTYEVTKSSGPAPKQTATRTVVGTSSP